MSLNPAQIVELIQRSIPDADIDVHDMRGDGEHYALYIESSSFNGKTRLEQHQLVYKALGDLIDDDLQALAIQTAEKK